jgi:hypothetical protein
MLPICVRVLCAFDHSSSLRRVIVQHRLGACRQSILSALHSYTLESTLRIVSHYLPRWKRRCRIVEGQVNMQGHAEGEGCVEVQRHVDHGDVLVHKGDIHMQCSTND